MRKRKKEKKKEKRVYYCRKSLNNNNLAKNATLALPSCCYFSSGVMLTLMVPSLGTKSLQYWLSTHRKGEIPPSHKYPLLEGVRCV